VKLLDEERRFLDRACGVRKPSFVRTGLLVTGGSLIGGSESFKDADTPDDDELEEGDAEEEDTEPKNEEVASESDRSSGRAAEIGDERLESEAMEFDKDREPSAPGVPARIPRRSVSDRGIRDIVFGGSRFNADVAGADWGRVGRGCWAGTLNNGPGEGGSGR